MTQVSWAKEAWREACTTHKIEIGFNGEIIQMITCCTSHLTSEGDEGIMFEKYFTPFPIPALALLYTAAECCIDEWTDGERSDIHFSSGEYKAVYDKHLANLKKFDSQTKAHGILDSILKDSDVPARLGLKAPA
ncbi:hypothetical protein P692DRAFT_201873422 [Suillus brevipes Sb2]|nr:hypothetical protein P692DRAFT_201873422 [Suillus brevipes Sb2]